MEPAERTVRDRSAAHPADEEAVLQEIRTALSGIRFGSVPEKKGV